MDGKLERTAPDVLDAFHQAMLDLSSDALADLHAVDAVYEFPLLTPGRPDKYVGRESIRHGFQEVWATASTQLAVTEIRNVIVHRSLDPEVLIVEHEAIAALNDLEKRVAVPSLVVLRVRNGLLVHTRDYSAGTRRPLA